MNKGFAVWMATKISFMIYAILILSALFSFYFIVNDFFQQQQVITQTEEIANLIDSISSSPYNSNISINLKNIDYLTINSTPSFNYIMLKKGKYNYSRVIQPNVIKTSMNNPDKISIIKNESIQVVKWE